MLSVVESIRVATLDIEDSNSFPTVTAHAHIAVIANQIHIASFFET